MATSVIILAAGKGTRMRSSLPKVLQPLAGQPLLGHVINTAKNYKQQKSLPSMAMAETSYKKHFHMKM